MQRLAVGRVGRQQYPIAEAAGQFDEGGEHRCLEVAGEGVLHQDQAPGAQALVQFGQALWRRRLHGEAPADGAKVEVAERRAVDHAQAFGQQRIDQARAHRRVVQPGQVGQQRQAELQRADQVVAQRAQVAAVVELEEARAELRHVDLDRALPRAGLARQAAGHGVVDLVGEVVATLAAVAPALGQRAQELQRAAGDRGQHVDAGQALQAQPFTDQRGAALGRLHALAGGLPGRAHGVVGVEVVAGAVAVAVHGAAVALPHTLVDLPVQVAAHHHFVDLQQGFVTAQGRGDLARVELVVRVAGVLQRLQRRVQLAEEGRRVFRAHPLAVLAPEQPAVALGQLGHGVGDRAYHGRLGRVLHVQCRAHVQHAGVDVAEHAVGQAVAVEQGTELGDELGEMLRRHGGIFDERLRAHLALDVAEQAHRALAHGVHAGHGGAACRQSVAQALHAAVVLQVLGEGGDAGVDFLRLIAAEFHQVDAQGRDVRILREVLGHAMPDDVLHGQQEHLGVHRLDRQRLMFEQRAGIAQGVHEAGVAHVDQHRVARDRQYVELGLDDQPQRAFGATQHAVEIEAPVGLAQVRQVVAGQAAVELGKARLDQLGLLALDGFGAAVQLADPVLARQLLGQLLVVQCGTAQALAAEQHAVEFEHMVAGLAVGAAALAAGVGVDHAADGGAVGGGQLRGEEQAVRLEGGVELVLDHAALHPHPAPCRVDLENPVEVPRQVHHHAVGQRLAVGAGAAAAWSQAHAAMGRFGGDTGQDLHVFRIQREHRRLRQALVDRVVGGQYRAAGVIAGDLAAEAGAAQGVEKGQVGGRRCGGRGDAGNHGRFSADGRSNLLNAKGYGSVSLWMMSIFQGP